MLIGIDDIRAAAGSLQDHVVRTPLLRHPKPLAGTELWLKPENLQRTGSFKVRGAFNTISSLTDSERARGVITYSSGNHAQATAYAASAFGVRCVVVMPDDARPVKVEATRHWGAKVIMVPPAERREHAEKLAVTEGLALIPPYDHPKVVAGQGTVGLEILADLPAPAAVFVQVGGGALASGVATAVKTLHPRTSVIGVEPELAADAAEGLRKGSMATWSTELTGRTAADGLRTNLCPLTFEHLAQYLDEIVTVTEDEIRAAVVSLALDAHLVVEPSGAVAVAGYLGRGAELPAGPSVAVLSGGNVDPGWLVEALSSR